MKLDLDYRKVEVPYGTGTFAVEMRPLDMAGYQTVLRLLGAEILGELGKPAQDKEEAAARLRRVSIVMNQRLTEDTLQKAASAVLPGHVGMVEGLTIREGGKERPCTAEDLASQGALAPLALMVLFRLINISVLTADDEGNSGGPPASTSPRALPGGPGSASETEPSPTG